MPSLTYAFLIPPDLFITLALVGVILMFVWRRLGIGVMIVAGVALYLSALPLVATLLLRQLESRIPIEADSRGAQAIVVLGGDIRLGNGGNEPDSPGPVTIERLDFAARLYHLTGLPVAVTSGRIDGSDASLGALMRTTLEQDFGVPVRWTEERSRTTFENALYTGPLLRGDGIGRVVLITDAWHLPRALWSFERVGVSAVPGPVPRTVLRPLRVRDFLPSIGALHLTSYAVHEMIGQIYYDLRY